MGQIKHSRGTEGASVGARWACAAQQLTGAFHANAPKVRLSLLARLPSPVGVVMACTSDERLSSSLLPGSRLVASDCFSRSSSDVWMALSPSTSSTWNSISHASDCCPLSVQVSGGQRETAMWCSSNMFVMNVKPATPDEYVTVAFAPPVMSPAASSM